MLKITFILLLAVVLSPVCAEEVSPVLDFAPSSSAQWIVYPEEVQEGRNHERYLRTAFSVEGEIRKATLLQLIDDTGSGTLNGKYVSGSVQKISLKLKSYDVTRLLVQGENVLAYDMVNQSGYGGVMLHLEIEYKDGRIQDVCSDRSWKASRSPEEGWRLPHFNDSGWKNVDSFGDIRFPIWAKMFPMESFLTRQEKKQQEELTMRRQERGECLLQQLSQEPVRNSSIVYQDSRAYFRFGDELLPAFLYNVADNCSFDTEGFRLQTNMLGRNGLKFHSVILLVNDDLWRPDGSIDFESIQKLLLNYLELVPDAYFDIAISFSRPLKWWREKYLDECVDYANGGRNPSESNVQKNFVAGSYASEKWLHDSTDVIRRIVDFLEHSPLAARIFAYQPNSGIYTEWHYWGMPQAMPDCSMPMTTAFRKWLSAHYADDSALQAAWGQSDVTLQSALTPPREIRLAAHAGNLRDAKTDRWVIDYFSCMAEVERDCVLAMNKAAKEACHGRALVGNYYGYFFGMKYPAEGWHLINDQIIDSPYTDFQISPFCYGEFFRKLGGCDQIRCLVDSYRLKDKLCILECDTRTFLQPQDSHVFATNEEESVALLARGIAQAFAHGAGLWFYDFGRCWYSSPKLEKFFQKLDTFTTCQADFSSAAEIAVIGDWESVPFHAIEGDNAATYGASVEIPREIGYCGVPYDMLSLQDLTNSAVKAYKVYCFLNLFHMTEEKKALVNQLKGQGHTLIWIYAAGYLTDDGPSLEAITELTGFHVADAHDRIKPRLEFSDGTTAQPVNSLAYSPVLFISEPEVVPMAKTSCAQGTVPVLAQKEMDNWTSVLCTVPYLSERPLREILKTADVFRYCDKPRTAIYANASMVMIHTNDAGKYTLHSPESVCWEMFFPEKREFGTSVDLEFEANANTTYFFHRRPLGK